MAPSNETGSLPIQDKTPLLLRHSARPAIYCNLAVALFLIGLALRVLYILHWRFNSDEPQHVHVLWMGRLGLIQYRDFRDNHAPLFYQLWTPLTRLLARDVTAMTWLRVTMLPVYFATLACTYAVARPLFTRRIALWAAGLLALWPGYYQLTVEFRPDQLWATLWIAAVAMTVRGPRTGRCAFLLGLLLGTATMISLKTAPLILCLLVTAGMTRLIFRRRLRWNVPIGLAGLAGFLVAPAAVLAYFARRGGLAQLYACTIGYNVGPGVAFKQHGLIKIVAMASIILLAILIGRRLTRTGRYNLAFRRRAYVLCLTLITTGTFRFLWPVFEPQNWLTLRPLIIVSLVGGIVVLRKKIGSLRARQYFEPAALLAMVGFVIFLVINAPYKDRTVLRREALEEAVKLVRPGESVIDLKGELLFFPRALAPVYETLLRNAIKNGHVIDDGPEQIMKHPAYVAPRSIRSFPQRTRQFLHDNFVLVHGVSVAGKVLGDVTAGQTVRFRIELPEQYDVITPNGLAFGTIDSQPINGPVYLGVGEHVMQSSANQPVAIFWHRAAELKNTIYWNRTVSR